MKRDWDYVAMTDYQADMESLSQQSSAIIENQRKEIDDMRKLICTILRVVKEVRIPQYMLVEDDNTVFEASFEPEHNEYVYQIRTHPNDPR